MTSPSILVIGATGDMGKRVLTAASQHPSKPLIHAFVRTPSKLTDKEKMLCTSVIKGDGTMSDDIERALEQTKADYVITTIGLSNTLGKQDLRERNAKALVSLIGPGCKYDHVKVVVVSSMGAGDTKGKIKMGYGKGTLFSYIIRNPLADHDMQEAVIKAGMNHEFRRAMIVRPTNLMNEKSTGKVDVFESEVGPRSWYIDRMDVALWIIREICEGGKYFGKDVNITGSK